MGPGLLTLEAPEAKFFTEAPPAPHHGATTTTEEGAGRVTRAGSYLFLGPPSSLHWFIPQTEPRGAQVPPGHPRGRRAVRAACPCPRGAHRRSSGVVMTGGTGAGAGPAGFDPAEQLLFGGGMVSELKSQEEEELGGRRLVDGGGPLRSWRACSRHWREAWTRSGPPGLCRMSPCLC